MAIERRHNELDAVPDRRRLHWLLNCWFKHRSKKTSKLRVTGLCVGNSPVAGEFPAQRASNAESISIWWRHHGFIKMFCMVFMILTNQLKHYLSKPPAIVLAYWNTIALFWALLIFYTPPVARVNISCFVITKETCSSPGDTHNAATVKSLI